MRLGSPLLLSESTHRVRGSSGFGTGSINQCGGLREWNLSSWEFPTLEWRTPLRNSSAQRQLESLSPHGLDFGNLLDQYECSSSWLDQDPASLSSRFLFGTGEEQQRELHVRESQISNCWREREIALPL